MRFSVIFLIAAFATCFTQLKANDQQGQSSKSLTEKKIYIDAENLYFGTEGIFLKTPSEEWKSIDHVCYDALGYYVKKSKIDFDIEAGQIQEFYSYDADVIECGSRVSPEPKKWKCPYCNHWWLIGEKCQNEYCPTNQWKEES